MNKYAIRRSSRARAAITALNLILPGLGLLRLSIWRKAIGFFLAPFALIALFTFGLGNLPITGFGIAVAALTLAIALVAMLYIAAMISTWQQSANVQELHWYSRWYSLAGVTLAMAVLSQGATNIAHRFYKPFYAASVSMAPTLSKDDEFVAAMSPLDQLTRGEIVLFRDNDSVRINRIVGLPGDRIAMANGVPVVNGMAWRQRRLGRVLFKDVDTTLPATLIDERMPGASTSHTVLDLGPSDLDDMAQVTVPADHIFVLGDNRDRSADSRVQPSLNGAGMVPVTDILGRALYIHWSADRSRIGTRLDR